VRGIAVNDSTSRGKSGTPAGRPAEETEPGSTSPSADSTAADPTDDDSTGDETAAAFPGSAAKKSLASLAITATSGSEATAADIL